MTKPNFERELISQAVALARRHWGKAALLICLTSIGTIVHHVLFPSYSARSTLLVRTTDESPLMKSIGKISGYSWTNYRVESPTEKYLKILQSRSFYEYVETQAGELAGEMVGSTYFQQNDNLLQIIARSRSAKKAAKISAAMAKYTQKYIAFYERKDIDDAEVYLKRQLDQIQSRINAMNAEIADLTHGNAVLDPVTGLTALDNVAVAKLKENEAETEFRLEETQRLLKRYSKEIGASRAGRGLAANVGDVAEIPARGRLVDYVRKLDEELVVYRTRLQAIQDRLKAQTSRPQNLQRAYDIKKKLDLEHTLFQDIQRQIFENEIYLISIENQIRTYELAKIESVTPDVALTQKLGFSNAFVLVFALVGLLLWRRIHPVVTDRRQFAEIGLKYLGAVPDMTLARNRRGAVVPVSKNLVGSLIHNVRVRNRTTAAFQFISARIFQNLMKVNSERRGVVSIVSHQTNEGKTVLSANLAVATASFGLRTLVISLDWFKSKGTNNFDIEAGKGLYEVLNNGEKAFDVIVPTKYPNVDYLSPGLSQGTMGIEQQDAYRAMINELKQVYDIVIVDTPAFEVGAEALTVAEISDVAIVVTKAEQTPLEAVVDIVDNLSMRQANIFGVINCLEHRSNYSEGYYEVASVSAKAS